MLDCDKTFAFALNANFVTGQRTAACSEEKMPYLIITSNGQKLITVAKSDDYNAVWGVWEADRTKKVIVWSTVDIDEPSYIIGPYYNVIIGKKPAVYASYEFAEEQTDGITRKPKKFTNLVEACREWLRSDVNRQGNRVAEVMRKSCGCCWYCGEKLTEDLQERGRGQKEHQIPKHKQGSNEVGNLVYACHRCNVEDKNWRDVEQYRTKLLLEYPHKYPDGRVIFFGEWSREKRHAYKLMKDADWHCPSTQDIVCMP